MRARELTGLGVVAVLTFSLVATFGGTASARWSVHNDADVTQLTAPAGGTDTQVCSNRLVGESGFSEFVDISNGDDPSQHTLDPVAFEGVAYDVWQAPSGSTNFTEDDTTGQVFVTDSAGNQIPATLAVQFTTPPRTLLTPPVPANGNPNVSDLYIFTRAEFSVALPSSVHRGDVLGVKPSSGGSTFIELKVITCPTPLTARVDVRPGSSQNEVFPAQWQSLVPVLIFGTDKINVTRISRVRLAHALPADVPSSLKPSLQPTDVDHDGKLDRLYYFRTWKTSILCGDTSADVTGRTASGTPFTQTSTVTTLGCP